ncbi:MAG TPA: hypothetical protein VG841_07960 [Caulobacterales bacterium]|nr:hypothetical protein [Caulobacterales bacterium]
MSTYRAVLVWALRIIPLAVGAMVAHAYFDIAEVYERTQTQMGPVEAAGVDHPAEFLIGVLPFALAITLVSLALAEILSLLNKRAQSVGTIT